MHAKRLVRGLRYMLIRAHRESIRRPILTLVLFFSFLTASFLPLGRLRMLLSIDDLIDPDFKTYQQLKDLGKDFLDHDQMFVVLNKTDQSAWQKSELCSIRRWIQLTADNNPHVHAIVSTLGIQWPTETAQRFKMSPLINIDCTSAAQENEAITAGFEKLKSSPWAGTLTSKSANDVGVLIYPEARNDSDFFGTFRVKVVDDLKESLSKEVLSQVPNVSAAWVGDGIFQYYLRKGYEAMSGLNLLISLLVIIFFRIVFGNFVSSAVFLSCVTWVTIPIYGGMALMNHPIDVLSSSLSLMIFLSSMEDFIFLASLLRVMSWRKAIRKMIVPSFFTSLTTLIGFGSLAFADIAIVRRFGLWAGLAAGLEWVVLFFAFPAVCVKVPWFRNWSKSASPSKAANFLDRLSTISTPRPLKYAMLIVFPLALFASQRLFISDSPEKLLAPSHPTRQDLNYIEASRGWRANVNVVFADHEDRAFNQAVLDKIRSWPIVEKIEDPYSTTDYLSSPLTENMRGYLQSILETSTIGHRLGPVHGSSRAIIYVKNLDIVDINKMRQEVLQICPVEKCWLAGTLVSYGELGERVLSTLYKSLGVSIVLVAFILLFLCFGLEIKGSLQLIVSSLWGPAALLAVFYIFKVPVFYVTSMIASILVAITGDNAIQFLFFSNREGLDRGLTAMAPAATLVSIAMMLVASVFFFGYFEPMKLLGLMLIVGFVLSILGDVWVLRSWLGLKPTR